MRKKHRQPVVSWWTVGLIVCLFGLGLYLLFPDKREIIRRMIAVDANERALLVMDTLTQQELESDRLYYRTSELMLRRKLLWEKPTREDWDDLYREGWSYYEETNFADAVFEELTLIIPAIEDLEFALEAVRKHEERLEPVTVDRFLNLFIDRGLALDRPAWSARLLASYYGDRRLIKPEAIRLAKLWRMGGEPNNALLVLQENRPESMEVRGRDWLDLEVALLRELERGSEALDMLLSWWDTHPDLIEDKGFIATLHETAIQSDRQLQMIPVFAALHERDTADDKRFEQLLTLLMADQQNERARDLLDRRYGAGLSKRGERKLLAQLREWTKQPDLAYDLYLELAREGNVEALDRLIALNPSLLRHFDLAEILEARVPVAERPDITLVYARLLKQIGYYEQAAAEYDRYLEHDPIRPDLYLEQAEAWRTAYHFDKAVASFEQAQRIAKDNTEVRMRLAWTLSVLKRYDEALAIYEEVYTLTKDPIVLREILSLASLTGRRDLYLATLERIIELDNALQPDLLAGLEDMDEAAYAAHIKSLEMGVELFRGVETLRLEYVYLLTDAKRFEEALEGLSRHSEIQDKPELASLLLYLMSETDQMERAADLLDSGLISEKTLLNADVAATAAWVYETNQRLDEAQAIWRRLHESEPTEARFALPYARLLLAGDKTDEAQAIIAPFMAEPTPEIMRLLTDIFVTAQDYEQAQGWYVGYLNSFRPETPTARELGFLGDIRLDSGDTEGAREAYELALRQMIREVEQL